MADLTLDVPEIQVVQNFPNDGHGYFWHHRVLLHKFAPGRWIGLTPDLDRVKINLNRVEYRVLERRAQWPGDIQDEIYAHDPISKMELSKHKRLAKVEGALFDDSAPEELASLVWVVNDPASGFFDTVIDEDDMLNAAIVGPEGVIQIRDSVEHVSQIPLATREDWKKEKSGTLGDIRLLGDHRDGRGKRYLDFSKALSLLRETSFDDWSYNGPRATKELLAAVRTGAGSLLSYHLQWVTNSGVYQYRAAAHEHKVLVEVVRKALEVDQLDVSNLTAFEDIIRRIIQIEVAVSRNPSQPDYTGLEELLEAPVDASGRASASSVEHWLTERLKVKANINKQARLFKEEFSGKKGQPNAASKGSKSKGKGGKGGSKSSGAPGNTNKSDAGAGEK